MLTDAQLRKLEEIDARLAEAETDGYNDKDRFHIMRDAYRELAELVKHLGRSRPDEYEFPMYAALVNGINNTAFALKLAVPMTFEKRMELGARRNQVVFEHDVLCHQTEALIVVRPWIRVCAPASPETIERLSAARITFAVDGDALINEMPLREHLIGPDGYGFRCQPFGFKGLRDGYGFFKACALTPDGLPGLPLDGSGGWGADASKELGIFLPNASKLTIDITQLDGLEQSPAPVMIGLVAATYTTRQNSTLPKRKQDWSPRDP